MMLKKLTTAAIAALLLLGCGGNAARSHRSQDGASAGGRYQYGDTARVSYYADYVEERGIPRGIGELTERQMSGRRAHYRFVYGGGKLRSVTFANSVGRSLGYDHSLLVGRVSIMEFEYGDDGRLAATKMKDKLGAPLATYRWSGDDHDVIDLSGPGPGFCMTSTSIDLGMFCKNIHVPWIINRFKLTRDARGYVTRWEFWSDEGMAIDLNRVAGFDYALDSLGRPVTLYMLGSDGQRKPDANGVAGRSFEYDARGNIAKVVFFGGDNKPVLNDDGWAIAVYETDRAGNTVSRTYLGANGELVLDIDGIAQRKNEYDKRGYPTSEAFFDTDGNLTLNRAGYAKMTAKNDDSGRALEIWYLGTDGKPILMAGGYARMTVQYDERGNTTEQAFFGADGKPVMMESGYARKTAQYDERGNMTEQAFFGTDGKPIMHADGVARVVMKYDERGNTTERAFFDTDGNPVLQKDGVARVTTVYDEHDNVTEEAYFGVDGEPTMHPAVGIARVVIKYDERGNTTEQAFFGTDGNPVLIDGHYAKITRQYDARGNVIEEILYGVDGKPIDGNEESGENEDGSGAAVDPASVVRDTFTDPRDNQTYRTTRIGNQTWMAENLNHQTEGSWCYDDDPSNCDKYGRLYTWDAAMKACPAGWRLPSIYNWNDLKLAVGGGNVDVTGTRLKSKSGWDENGNGTDDYGFSAMPGGFRTSDGNFRSVGSRGDWWSIGAENDANAWRQHMSYGNSYVALTDWDKAFSFSVRCVCDD